jgi:3-hydroxybutyryl-CoA dehydrogenase
MRSSGGFSMNGSFIGVIGAGVMGSGIAYTLAQSEYSVLLIDVSDTALVRVEQEIRRILSAQHLLKLNKGRAEQGSLLEQENIMGRISYSVSYEPLRSIHFVIENVTEKWEAKKIVYERLGALCPPDCIFAVNTSAIPITRIASIVEDRASYVIGMHFMNPVYMKKMVELICGYHTSQETLQEAKLLLTGINKEWIVVNDSPGFVTNRVLMLTINEAIYLLQEGVASVEDIDTIFKNCFDHKLGPLETADLIGLDTVLLSIEVLYESFSDSKYRPCPLLRKMVNAGLHGRKSGRGFYLYP